MPPSSRAPKRLLHAVLGLGVAVTAIACLAAGPAQASTAGDNHSPAVVANALAALAAEDALIADTTADTLTAYVTARDATADSVAAEMALDPIAVRDAWSRADMPHQRAVLAALAELGKQYRYATSDPNVGFDCSGLTAYAWEQAGVSIPHQSSAQIRAAAPAMRRRRWPATSCSTRATSCCTSASTAPIVHAANRRDDVELDFVTRRVRFGDPIG